MNKHPLDSYFRKEGALDIKFRTKTACQIAGIDHQRFNEDVAAGEYPCAPPTTAGIAREFAEEDIAGLMVYGHLTKGHEQHRYGKKLAAKYACGVIDALRQGTLTDRGRVDFPFQAADHVVAASEAPPQFGTLATPPGVVTTCFDLKKILQIVRERMVKEARIFGEED